LKADIAKAVASLFKHNKDMSARQEKMADAMRTHKGMLLKFTRCPSGVMVNAEKCYQNLCMGEVTRSSKNLQYDIKVAVENDIMGAWRKVVEDEFDGIWAQCISDVEAAEAKRHAKGRQGGSARPVASTKNSSEGSGSGEDGTAAAEDADNTSGKNHRVCTSTLKTILRPDMSNHFEQIVDLLEHQQRAATDLEDKIYTLVHKETLVVSTRFFIATSPLPELSTV
jgi:hypothetical protein